MTEEQRKLCRGLVITPPRGVRLISIEDFLRQFPSAVEGGKLALRLLEDAYRTQNTEDLECALIVGYVFGFGREHVDILCHLIEADWHYSHEDVVGALDKLRTSDAVEALYNATLWIPKSLEYDDSRALAVKAIWALGRIPSAEARANLEILAHSNDTIVRSAAIEQLNGGGEHT